MNSKLNTILLDRNTLQPVVPTNTIEAYAGTESGHFFTKVADLPGAVITFRNTDEAVSVDLSDGRQARIRIIPAEEDFGGAALLEAVGFTRKGDEPNVHYSMVTNKAKSLIDALVVLANVITE